jgi:hypothetical protein
MHILKLIGLRCNTAKWGQDLVTRLLEATHGQWLYCNVQVHDRIAGTLATQWKEELQMEIERQQKLGKEGLLEEDCYLAECNLGDLEETSGMLETYWLLAIQAAREAGRLEGVRLQAEEASWNTS